MTSEPSSLSDMQDMEAEEFEAVDRYDYRGSVSPKRVIRHMIELAADELEWQGRSDSNSLRDFWYNPTKPILERAFPEKVEDPDFKFSRRMSQYLSDTMSEMVTDGAVSYRELNILDDSRERKVNRGTIEDDKILFVEKDAAYRKLKPLEQTYRLSLVSGSGFQATALIEDLAHELTNGQEYTLYVLSDYDPTGYKIVDDFEERAGELGINVGEVKRLGIKPSQLNDDTIIEQRFSPPVQSEADEEWLREFGIEGEYGLELEAIGDLNNKGPELRKVVVEALKDDIRVGERLKRDTEKSTGSGAQSAVQTIVSDVTGDLEDGLMEQAVSILSEVDGIEEVSHRFGSPDVEIESLDVAKNTDLIAEPPEEEKLHRGAVSGRYYGASKKPVAERVEEELREKIETGEIDVLDLLGVEG